MQVDNPREPLLEKLPLPLRGAAGAVRTLAIPFWFFFGGYDWVVTLTQVVGIQDSAVQVLPDAPEALLLYFVRHGALYYALSKWVLEWNRQLFSESDM